MSDLISRQDAIDVLDVLCQEHRYKIPGNAETYSQYNEAWQDALDRAEGAIGNLPSAEPEPHWIPCSEKLPDACGKYLVTMKWHTTKWNGDIEDEHITIKTAWYGEWDDIGWGWSEIFDVLAWMPLPEPYEEKL